MKNHSLRRRRAFSINGSISIEVWRGVRTLHLFIRNACIQKTEFVSNYSLILQTQIVALYLQRHEGHLKRRAVNGTSRLHEFTIRASGNVIQLLPA